MVFSDSSSEQILENIITADSTTTITDITPTTPSPNTPRQPSTTPCSTDTPWAVPDEIPKSILSNIDTPDNSKTTSSIKYQVLHVMCHSQNGQPLLPPFQTPRSPLYLY